MPVPGKQTQLRWPHVLACCAATLLVGISCAHSLVRGETQAAAESSREAVTIRATFAQTWQQDGEVVHLLRGECQIAQGETTIRSERAVVWRIADPSGAAGRERIIVYLEEGVRVDEPGSTLSERTLLLNLKTESGTTLQVARPTNGQPAGQDPTYQRATARRAQTKKGAIRRTQYAPEGSDAGPELRSVQLTPPEGGMRRVQIYSRTGGKWDSESFPSPDTTPAEQVVVLKGGVNVLIDGIDKQGGGQPVGPIDLSADRIVIWTDPTSGGNLDGGGGIEQASDLPLQMYLEGHIIIRQGTNELQASQAFYDVREKRALLLNAELRAKIAKAPAGVRVRAQQLRMIAEDTYQAQQAWITTSDFGKPGYRLQASDIFIEPRYENPYSRSGEPRFNDETGELDPETTLWATTLNNTFYVEDVPLFYFPYLSVPAEDPNIPLRNVNVQNDRIFGVQLRTTWDMFKLLGWDTPDGGRWDLNADYLSKRGPKVGFAGSYRGQERFGLDGPYKGNGYVSFIYDTGHDNLGNDRLNLIPAQEARGGLLVRDRQSFTNGITWSGEAAFLSDRNWLEEYRQVEFDNGKDYETLGYLKQQQGNWAWSALVRPRLYDYYNETAWLPRGDLFVLGQPLFGSWLTWSSHTYAGLANQAIAKPPTDPADKWSVLPFEANASGLAAATRHEVDMPFQLGPVNFVPYALGEAAYWSDTATPIGPLVDASIDQGSLGRLWGSGGLRGSVELSKIFYDVQSDTFNLNGLAHKMVFDADYSYSRSTQSLNDVVPQFNEIDDNAQEQFRRRLYFNTFNQNVPATFEPRFFALRSGVAQNVTAPYNEIVDDFQVLRLGWRHRLQTKVGPANAQRIKNWMTLDLETSYFPDKNRDNFGEAFGLYSARYNWYVGDRTTVTAGTLFDTFDNNETLWNVGLISQRTARGSMYVGLRNIEGGPLLTRILTASYSYLMSPKWLSTASTAYDLGENQNRGQSVTLTRIGSDFLIHFGANVDATRNNYGFGLSVEPRFAPRAGNFGQGGYGTQLGSLLPPPGR
jgi:lipopolysaccharide export system protein LptA